MENFLSVEQNNIQETVVNKLLSLQTNTVNFRDIT